MNYTSQGLQWFKYNKKELLRTFIYNVAQHNVHYSGNKFYDLDGSGYEDELKFYEFTTDQQDFTIDTLDNAILTLRY